MKTIKQIFIYIIFTALLYRCTEPFNAKTGTLEEALVVESTITNELKNQTVKLSRVSELEIEVINTESNAQVWVEDSNGNNFTFTETISGTYNSDIEFKAEPQIEYKLFITTQNGNQYESLTEFLTPNAPISNIYAEREIVNEVEGIQIYIDNSNNNNAKYFRYEFEETYKIVTPYEFMKARGLLS